MHLLKQKKRVLKIRIAKTFLTRGLGLMFTRPLARDEGLLLDLGKPSRTLASIHMLFVFFPLRVFWLDECFRVIDTTVARPFRLHYAPRAAARYILEAHHEQPASIGERFTLEP